MQFILDGNVLPDAIVRDLLFSPANPEAGDSVTARFTIAANNAPISSIYYEVYLDGKVEDGDYANGIDSGIIDLVLIGEIKQDILNRLTNKTETLINRKIRSVVLTKKEFKKLNKTLDIENSLLIWG